MDTTRKTLKKRIVISVRRNGLPVSAEYIAKQVAISDDTALKDLLSELVTEGQLLRRCTLQVNGEVSYTYDLAVNPSGSKTQPPGLVRAWDVPARRNKSAD